MRTRTLLTLALAGLSPAVAQAQYCPEPTLERCRDVVWLETPCGQQAMRDGCFELVADGAMEDGHRLPEAMRLSLDGELEPVRYQAYQPWDQRYDIEGPASWSEQVAMTAARATAIGSFEGNFRESRHRWESDGTGFSTCEEYVYEKYLSVSRIEDVTAIYRHDAARAVAVAREASMLAEVRPDPWAEDPVFVGADGEAIDREGEREIRMVARNPWLATPPEVLDARPDLADKVLSAEPRPDTLGWQVYAAERLSEVPVETLEAHGQAAARYAADLAERARLVEEMEVARREDDGESLEALAARIGALDGSLVEQLAQADRFGCLDPADEGVGACDWQPQSLLDAVADRFAEAREADYQACKAIEASLGGDLTALRDRPIVDLYEEVLYEGRDWLESFRTFDLYRQLEEAAKARREQQAAAEREAEARRIAQARAALTQADGSVASPEKRHHKFARMGDANFNLFYEYLMRYRVFDFERVLCNVNAEFEAMFRAGTTIFGKQIDLLYARLFANLHRYEGDLRIAGQSLYHDHRNLVGKLHFDLVKPTDVNRSASASANAWFTVVFVPVKVEGGISGRVGLKYRARAGIDKGGNNCTHVAAYIEGEVEPYTRVDAFASLAIELLVARGGIKGRLELLTLSLPFNTRIALNAPRGDIRALELTVRTKLDLALRALSGSISLWGEAGWCPFCIKGETVIFKWNGPKYRHNIFDVRLGFPLFGLKRILEGA